MKYTKSRRRNKPGPKMANGDNSNGKPLRNFNKAKTLTCFEWDNYLKYYPGPIAPAEFFNHSIEPPINEFQLNQKLEVTSPDNNEMIHLATVVGFKGPRLQLRFDGCDNSNDVFKIVDSKDIYPVNTEHTISKYLAAPLRYRKDPTKYVYFVKSVMQNAIPAPEHCFKKSPKVPTRNLFQPSMKLEAADTKCPANICPATIISIEDEYLEIHLDGWESSNDFKVVYTSRDIFPVGWCKKTGNILQQPGPKINLSKIPRAISNNNDDEVHNGSNLNETSTSISQENGESNLNTTIIINGEKEKINTLTTLSGDGKRNQIIGQKTTIFGEEKSKNLSVKTTSSDANKGEKNSMFPQKNPYLEEKDSPDDNEPKKTTTLRDEEKNQKIFVKSFFGDPDNWKTTEIVPQKTTTSHDIGTGINNSNVSLKTTSNDGSSSSSSSSSSNSKLIMKIPVIKTPNGQMVKFQHPKMILNNSIDINNGKTKIKTAENVSLSKKPFANSTDNSKTSIINVSVASAMDDGNNKIKLNDNLKTNNNNYSTTITNNGDINDSNANAKSGVKRKCDSEDKLIKSNVNKQNNMDIKKYQYHLPTRNIVQSWSVDQMVEFLNLRFPGYDLNRFKYHEIDGIAFLLLNYDVIMKFLSISLGLALKLLSLIEQIKRK